MPQLWGIDTRKQALNTGDGASSPRPSYGGGSNGPFTFGGLEQFAGSTPGGQNRGPSSLGAPPPTRAESGMTPSAGGDFKGVKKKPLTPEDIMQLINDYFTKKNKGLDFNDPRTKAILDNARATTMQSANDRGIFGGYSENAAEGSYIGAASKLQQQDDAMALQALGMMSGLGTGIADRQFQSEMAQWNKDNESNTSTGEMIGGGIGAGIGALGFLVPGVGPALGPAAMSAGSKIGAGIGGGIGGRQSGPMPTWGGY